MPNTSRPTSSASVIASSNSLRCRAGSTARPAASTVPATKLSTPISICVILGKVLDCFSPQGLERTSPGQELIQHRVDRFFVVLRRFENVEVLKIGHERELDLVLHGRDLEVGHHRAQLRHGSRSARTHITDKPRRLVVPLTVEKVDGVLERPIHAVVVLRSDKDVAVE